jgi:hypothetical protein
MSLSLVALIGSLGEAPDSLDVRVFLNGSIYLVMFLLLCSEDGAPRGASGVIQHSWTYVSQLLE